MDTVKVVSDIGENLSLIQFVTLTVRNEADVILQRLFTILHSQPGTIVMLDRQVMTFHKVMNRSTREHGYETYKNYAYATVGNYFKVKFQLLADSDAEVPEITLDNIEYIKDDTRLTCSFESLKMKIKSSPSTRNYRYSGTPFSFWQNFLQLTDTPTLESEEEVRMEIQDFLFDYTNLQELLENE